MGQFTDDFAPEIPRLRRYLALYYRRQRWADSVLRQFLQWVSPDVAPMTHHRSAAVHFFRQFVLFQTTVLNGGGRHRAPGGSERRMTDRRFVRHAMLMVEFCGFTLDEAAFILGRSTGEVLAVVEPPLEMPRASASVLIIEDDSLTAMDLSSIVTQLGYRVTGIASSEEAAVALAHSDPPDILLCDIHLSQGGSGIEAARRIADSHRPRPLIYVTANPSDIVVGPRPARPLIVGKPYARDEIRHSLDIALSRLPKE